MPRTRGNETKRIFDLAIPIFAYTDRKVAEGLLENEYGDKLGGLSGEKIYEDLKQLTFTCWEEMGEEERRPYAELGPKTIGKIKRSL